MILESNRIFNPYTVNIFTDASIKKIGTTGETIACPGCEVVVTDQYGMAVTVTKEFYFIRNATNNIGELSAILLGIQTYLKLQNNFEGMTVNLFSDSLLCINSLREWIFAWINNQYNYVWYSSSGEPVKNQEIIKQIIWTIFSNNMNINLFHQKGHVTLSDKSLKNAMRVFNNSNKVNVSYELIKTLSFFNNSVDVFTKIALDENEKYFYDAAPLLDSFTTFTMNNVNFSKYKKLIEHRR